MNDPVINSLQDMLLFVVPCIGLLIFTMFISLALFMCGCANQRGIININLGMAAKLVTSTIQPAIHVIAEVPKKEEVYVVQKGDCLWNIAAKPVVYGDAFQWPELWAANRDSIKNPDKIDIGLMLEVHRHFDKYLARGCASKWARYKK